MYTIFLYRPHGANLSMFVSQNENVVQGCAEDYPDIIYFFAEMILQPI